MKIKDVLIWAESKFEEAGLEKPGHDAEILLGHVLRKKRFDLLVDAEDEIVERHLKLFKELARKRLANMPISYIIQEAEFMSLPFIVNREVVIPRPETEILVEKVLSKAKGDSRVIDLGTGCGNIAVSIAKYSSCEVFGTDISKEAIKIAKKNAVRNRVERHVSFLQGDMFGPLKYWDKEEVSFQMGVTPLIRRRFRRTFDFVVSNPPYVCHDEIQDLPTEVRDYEPRIAFDGGEDGLRFYRIIARECQEFLRPRGYLAVEVGFKQADCVCDILSSYFKSIEVEKDYAGIERVVIARRDN